MWKLKLDEHGNVVVQDGKPIYVYEKDGETKEMAFDAPATLSKIAALNTEAKEHRLAKEQAQESLKVFEGIDAEKAKKALATVANLDDKKLIDAGEVEKVKDQLSGIYRDEKKALLDGHTAAVTEFQATIEKQTDTIRHLSISTEFAKSPWFSGEKPKTNLPPDLGAKLFGDKFKVEGEGSDVRVVGHLNDDKILSKDPMQLGKAADFETAISAIIEAYPNKERILATTPGGPGLGGNHQSGHGSVITLSRADSKVPELYRAAKDQAVKAGVPLNIT